MDKQVNGGEEGDIGKPSAGQKRDPENRLAVEEEETSKKARQDALSSSESDELLFKLFKEWAEKYKRKYKSDEEEKERFKLWCSCKEWVDKHNSTGRFKCAMNFLSDYTNAERKRFHGPGKPAPNPYNGNNKTPEFYESKLGKEVAKEEAAFDKWVAEQNKTYGSSLEREDKFRTYYQNKKRIKEVREEDPTLSSVDPPELIMRMDQGTSKHGLRNLLKGLPLLHGKPTLSSVASPELIIITDQGTSKHCLRNLQGLPLLPTLSSVDRLS